MNSRLIRLALGIVVAWILAFNTGNSLAYGLAYLTSGVLLFSYLWAVNGVRRISVRRFTKTRQSQVGQFAEEQIEVSNKAALPKLWLEIDDASTLPWHSVSRVISLGRNMTDRWQVRTLCTQRGRFRLGPLVLRNTDPLGIFRMARSLSSSGYLVVYPLTVDLPSFQPSISELAGGEARHRRTYQVTTNAAGVRDYVPGDSLNRIHWPTTARLNRLMAKEFELDPTADVWIYLDLNAAVEGALAWTPQPPEPGLFALLCPAQCGAPAQPVRDSTHHHRVCDYRNSQPRTLLCAAQSRRGPERACSHARVPASGSRRASVEQGTRDAGRGGGDRYAAFCTIDCHRWRAFEPQ